MTTAASFAPLRADTGETANLAMQQLWLTGQILPAGARLVVRHVFRSHEDKTIEVIYSFPLPRDAALRRFRITGEGFEAHSELKETAAAVKAYEDGISRGSLSTLARQYGDGVVNLTVGNIRRLTSGSHSPALPAITGRKLKEACWTCTEHRIPAW